MRKKSSTKNEQEDHASNSYDDRIMDLSYAANNISDATDKRFNLFQQFHENIQHGLAGSVWEMISYDPMEFIIAHTYHLQLIRGTVKFKTWNIYTDSGDKTDTEKVPELVLEDVIIGAIPIEIISHENPLSFAEHRYTIKFFSHTDKIFTIGPKTLKRFSYHCTNLDRRVRNLLCLGSL